MKRQYINEFLEHLSARGLSSHTVRSYAKGLDDFKSHFPGSGVPSGSTLQGMIDDMARRYKPNTVHVRVAALNTYFNYLVKCGHILSNPIRDIVVPKIPDALPRALDYDQVMDALEKSRGFDGFEGLRNRAIMELGYASAARASDLTHARVDNLDLEKCTLKVTGKGGVDAFLMFGVHAQQVLKEYLVERGNYVQGEDHGILFIRLDGKPLENIYAIVKKISGHGPHVTFRHSAATHMMENGADIATVSEFLRHKSLSTTRIYTRMTDNKLRRQYARYHPRA